MTPDDEKSLDVLYACIDKLTRLHPDEMGKVNAWIRAVMSECDKLAGENQRLRRKLGTARINALAVMEDAERRAREDREAERLAYGAGVSACCGEDESAIDRMFEKWKEANG